MQEIKELALFKKMYRDNEAYLKKLLCTVYSNQGITVSGRLIDECMLSFSIKIENIFLEYLIQRKDIDNNTNNETKDNFEYSYICGNSKLECCKMEC